MKNEKTLYKPSVYKIGFLGLGDYKGSINNKNTYCYVVWNGMLRRCYSKEYQNKFPSYKECSVVKEWHNFQNFAKWFYKHYKKNCVLDKDILIKGNKIYGPDNCAFVPVSLNNLITNNKKQRGNLPIGVRLINNKYISYVSFNKKQISLGTSFNIEEAFFKYKKYKEDLIKNQALYYLENNLINTKTFKALHNYKIEITD